MVEWAIQAGRIVSLSKSSVAALACFLLVMSEPLDNGFFFIFSSVGNDTLSST